MWFRKQPSLTIRTGPPVKEYTVYGDAESITYFERRLARIRDIVRRQVSARIAYHRDQRRYEAQRHLDTLIAAMKEGHEATGKALGEIVAYLAKEAA